MRAVLRRLTCHGSRLVAEVTLPPPWQRRQSSFYVYGCGSDTGYTVLYVYRYTRCRNDGCPNSGCRNNDPPNGVLYVECLQWLFATLDIRGSVLASGRRTSNVHDRRSVGRAVMTCSSLAPEPRPNYMAVSRNPAIWAWHIACWKADDPLQSGRRRRPNACNSREM